MDVDVNVREDEAGKRALLEADGGGNGCDNMDFIATRSW